MPMRLRRHGLVADAVAVTGDGMPVPCPSRRPSPCISACAHAQHPPQVALDADMQRLGSKLVRCIGACVDAPGGDGAARVVDDFHYEFLRRDRIGIVGPNGAGKT